MTEHLFTGSFPPEVFCEEGPILTEGWEVRKEEAAFAEKFVEKRKFEFLTGRTYARRAITRLTGSSPPPLLPGPDRAPRWGRGLVGSISHSSDFCAVIVASGTRAMSLGLDVETVSRVREASMDRICTREEMAGLEKSSPENRRLFLARIFSAKEAFYKLQFPITQSLLGFRDVAVEFSGGESFSVRLLVDAGRRLRKGRRFSGQCVSASGRVGTWMMISGATNSPT